MVASMGVAMFGQKWVKVWRSAESPERQRLNRKMVSSPELFLRRRVCSRSGASRQHPKPMFDTEAHSAPTGGKIAHCPDLAADRSRAAQTVWRNRTGDLMVD